MYIDKSYLTRYIETTRLNAMTGNDDTLLNNIIARASSIVDAYLQDKVSVPISSPSELIKGATADITLYLLSTRKFDKVPEIYEVGRAMALEMLAKISEGDMDFPGQPARGTANIFSITTKDKVFTDDITRHI